MKHRFAHPMVRALLLSALLISLSVAWAKQPDVFDQWDLLVDIRHELVTSYVEAPDQQDMVEAAVRGMVESLDDPYTTYLTQEELDPFDKYVRGSFSGIGAEIDRHNGRPRIVTPLEDSPAWNAGILAGDIILEIEGQSTLDMSLPDAVQLIGGEKGTTVTLRVRHESGEEAEITITRDTITIQTVRGFRRNADQHFDFMLDDTHQIGYVRITQFSERTADELRAALEQLKEHDPRGLILDLRFNPGGLLQSAVEVSDMFLPAEKRIVSVKGRVVSERVYSSTDQRVLPEIPIVVLANEASASAAEIVTGALADNDRARFVGTRTFGKGSVQQVKMLESGAGALKITNAYYYIPSGRLIHRRSDADVWGVDPSPGSWVPMSPQQVREMMRVRREADALRKTNGQHNGLTITSDWIREELKDPQMAAALEALLGKLQDDDWPIVGQSNEAALVEQSRRVNLQVRRDMLREQLDKVERELQTLSEAPANPPAPDANETEGPSQ